MLSQLNQRATLLAQTLVPDGGGGFAQSWEAFATVWIALAALGAGDGSVADHPQSRVRHRIVLRRRGDLAAGQRVALGERIFRVHGVLDDGARQATIALLCEELPGDAP